MGISRPIALIVVAFCAGCGGATLDYGDPAAQFVAADVATKGAEFVGKKVTVKGTVASVDTSEAGAARIHLKDGILCNLGKFQKMAESRKPGETVFVDGILKRCEAGNVVLDPAMCRDPNASFSPR